MSKAIALAAAAAALVRVGDIVLFKSLHREEMGNGADEVPAIVTRVWSPTYVNLHVIRDAADPIPVTSVTYDADAKGEARSWRFLNDALPAAPETATDASAASETATDTPAAMAAATDGPAAPETATDTPAAMAAATDGPAAPETA